MPSLYLDVSQQPNIPPASEMIENLAFTASEMILEGIPRHNGVTATFALFELQCAFTE